MSLETKRIVALPENETDVIDSYSSFGWELKSRNEIMNTTEHFDGAYTFSYNGISSTSVQTHQETTHFVSLLLERETTIPHYADLVLHERSFESLMAQFSELCKKQDPKIEEIEKKKEENDKAVKVIQKWGRPIAIGCIILLIYIIVSSILANVLKNPEMFGILCEFAIAGVALIILGFYYRYQLSQGCQKYDNKDLDHQISLLNADLAKFKIQVNQEIAAGRKILDENKRHHVVEEKPKEIAPVIEGQDTIETKLTNLKKLHDEGLISDEDFAAKKKEILSSL